MSTQKQEKSALRGWRGEPCGFSFYMFSFPLGLPYTKWA